STWLSTPSRSGPLSCSVSSLSSTPGEGHPLTSAAMRIPPRCAKGGRKARVVAEGHGRPGRRVGGPGGRGAIPVLYNHLPELLQLVRRRQVEEESVALPFRHVEEEGLDLDPDRPQLHTVLVVQGRLPAEHDFGAEVSLVLQHPGHLVPLHFPLHHC